MMAPRSRNMQHSTVEGDNTISFVLCFDGFNKKQITLDYLLKPTDQLFNVCSTYVQMYMTGTFLFNY
jgi:hypothetical protein